MRSLIHSLSLVFLCVFFSGCTLFKRSIKKPVTVAFDESLVQANMNSSALNAKYLPHASTESIIKAFVSGFKSEGANTYNVSLTNIGESADYLVRVTSLSVTESSRTEKISDPNSPYNGQDIVLNTVECSASVDIICRKDNNKTLSCSNIKSRQEKCTNSRSLGDLIFGTNKDHSNYRTKLLSDNIATSLSEDVGRRIWTPITRKIAKHI